MVGLVVLFGSRASKYIDRTLDELGWLVSRSLISLVTSFGSEMSYPISFN